MNFRTTYILFGTLVAVLLVFGLTQWLGLKKKSKDTDEYVFPSLHKDMNPTTAELVDTVEIVRHRPQEETFLFVRTPSGWEMQKPYQLRADKLQVDALVRQVMDARKDKAEMSKSLGQYELDRPQIVVTLRQGSEKEWKINVGTQSPGPEAKAVRYVTSSERSEEPMAVKRAELDAVFKKVEDFRSKELLEASAFNTTYVNLQLPGKAEPVILEKGSSGVWRFQKPAYGEADFEGDQSPALPPGRDKPLTGVKELLDTVGQLRALTNDDFGPLDASDSDLAKFGLEQGKPAFLRIEVKRRPGSLLGGDEQKEPVQEALLIGNKVVKDEKKKEKAGETGEKRYARLESEKGVVYVDAKKVEAIAKVAENPSVIRDRNLVKIDVNSVDAIDIKNASGLLKLRGLGLDRKLWVGSGKPRAADDQAVKALLTALNTPRQVQSFPDPAKEAEYGFEKPEAVVVSLWVRGLQEAEKKDEKKDDTADEKKDEKKDDKISEKKDEKKDADAEPKLKDPAKPTVKLTFGKEDKDVINVRREVGDEKSVLAVPKSLLAKVNQGPLAYLDRELPKFDAAAEVTTLVLDRSGESFEVNKEGDTWKFKQPKDLAGRSAEAKTVQDMIMQLRMLRADRLEAEGTVDLDKYGLKTPQVKATVKLKAKDDQKPEEWVYLFGKETEDKNGVYAKQDKRDMVFVVGNHVLTMLRGELQDLTVFRFDLGKVKSVTMVGWKQVAGENLTRIMERTGPNAWTMKKPPDFELDPVQIETFVASLAADGQRHPGLRAERFVVRKGGPQPEHKLGPKDPTFQIEITVEGEKEPMKLTIGGLDAKEKAYYAQASSLGNDVVFLLPQADFEKVLTDATYFRKKS